MKLTVVIPTRNEEANIANCIGSFESFRDSVEIIVVDNASSDRTKEIAASLGAKVFDKGPERCAQRNAGWRAASQDWVMFVDADMMLPHDTTSRLLSVISSAEGADAYWIPETRSGGGLRVKARNFERSFYDGTCIDGLRVIKRSLLEAVGGYDESLVACEDWDLDRRLVAVGARTALLDRGLVHNEARQGLRRLLSKKAYYAKSIDAYRSKWNNDLIVRRQFGVWYRFFFVFVENGKWKRLLRHPVLAAVMYFERVLVGFTYLFNR